MLMLQASTASGSAAALAMEPATPVVMAPANTMPDFKSSRRSKRPFPATGSSDTEPEFRRARAMSPSSESSDGILPLMQCVWQAAPLIPIGHHDTVVIAEDRVPAINGRSRRASGEQAQIQKSGL